eukprot:CAMPEP_0201543816 /NCGR_PEP_ID=MMETSP0161_2-20130828/72821_1 /ASSEMBLY_ACC=CAM_ASM_000251 /TAXON_ID=180227 /ORGANISM="Neoparamoeba aestuarina, Strain SoJaBio B1-5/56/2" /LENGTH=229 /DNA_ID=CAMNT_0047951661 /DNA_START=673 /DNA_END=1358 /DNA_ORIENTATION=+
MVYDSLGNLLSEEETTNKAIGCTVYSAEDQGNPSRCQQELACNWMDESAYTYPNSSSSSSFEDICVDPQTWEDGPNRDETHFCAICVGDSYPCVEIFGIDTKEKCEEASVCVTPTGGYRLKTDGEEWDVEECEKESGICAGYCEVDADDDDDEERGTDYIFDDDDVDCISFLLGSWSVCFYPLKVTESECLSWGGQFHEIDDDNDDNDDMKDTNMMDDMNDTGTMPPPP